MLVFMGTPDHIQAEPMTLQAARKILCVKDDATPVEIEQAYFKLVAQQRAIINSAPVARTYFDSESIVKIYGNILQDCEHRYHHYQDDVSRDKVFQAKEKLKNIRTAYESLSGKILEKIKLIPQEINTQGLKLWDVDWNLNYYMSSCNNWEKNWYSDQRDWEWKYNRYFFSLVTLHTFMQDMNYKNPQQETDYFVVGEPGQDESLLIESNKRQAVIDKQYEIYADGGDNCIIVGTVIAVAGLFVRSIFLDR